MNDPEFGRRRTDLVCQAIATGIAERSGIDVSELPPLHDTIDPEALETVVRSDASCRVSFEYAGYEVIVAGPHRITIHESEGGRYGPGDSIDPT